MEKITASVISLLIIAGLIVIHESGHFLAGMILGIPKRKMKIQFVNKTPDKGFLNSIIFCISPHLALKDKDNKIIAPSADEMDNFVEILEHYIPSEKKMFWFVAGGHLFELLIILTIAITSVTNNFLNNISFQIVRMALVLASVYLIMDLFSALKSKQLTGGDFSGQWAISPVKTIIFYLIYFASLTSLWIFLK